MSLASDVDESRLVPLINDPDRTLRRLCHGAACADLPTVPEPYFPEDGEPPAADALARCAACPVVDECLVAALLYESDGGPRFGWWGGRGPDERDLIAERVRLARQRAERTATRPAELARRLRAQHRTIASIAAELGCAERTIYRYLADEAA